MTTKTQKKNGSQLKQFAFLADSTLQRRFREAKAKRLLRMEGNDSLSDADFHREVYNEGLKKFEKS